MLENNEEDNNILEIHYYSRYWYLNKIQIKIFGESFVENNKDNCKIIYENKEYELTSVFDFESKTIDTYIIKLKGVKNITNMSCIFEDCIGLSMIPNMPKLDVSNVNNISKMFYGCRFLKSIPDISNWNTSNIKYISYLFYQ